MTAVGVGVGAGDEAAAGVAFHAAFQIVIGNGRGIQQQQQKRQQQQQRRHRQQKHHQQHHCPSVAPVRPSTARDSSLDRPPGPAPLDCLIYARVIVGLNVSQSVQAEGAPHPGTPVQAMSQADWQATFMTPQRNVRQCARVVRCAKRPS